MSLLYVYYTLYELKKYNNKNKYIIKIKHIQTTQGSAF